MNYFITILCKHTLRILTAPTIHKLDELFQKMQNFHNENSWMANSLNFQRNAIKMVNVFRKMICFESEFSEEMQEKIFSANTLFTDVIDEICYEIREEIK